MPPPVPPVPPRAGAHSRWRAPLPVLVRLVVGLWVFGTGEALLIAAAVGNSPWTVLAEGMSLRSPLTVGTATVLVSGLVLLCWVPLRERPGLGTVLNAVLVGVAIDVMLPVLPAPDAVPVQLVQSLLAIALVGLGSGLYLSTALGPGPRDGLMTGIARRTGWALWRVRFGIEATALVAGIALGGTAGVGTVLFAVLIGPAVQLALAVLGGRRDTPAGVSPTRSGRRRGRPATAARRRRRGGPAPAGPASPPPS